MNVEQIWNWQNFNGGEGDRFYFGPKGSYRAGEGINTRIVDNGVMLDNPFIDTGLTYQGELLAINRHEQKCFSTRNGNDGYVYNNGVYKLKVNTGTIAHNLIQGWGKMTKVGDNVTYNYGFSQTSNGVGKVHRLDPDYNGISYLSTRTCEFNAPNPTRWNLPTLSLPGKIIFGYANTIFEIDQYETITKKISFPKNCEIINITYYQDTFKIYYNFINGDNEEGIIAYWNGSSALVSQSVRYENSSINTVTNNGPVDYVVFGDKYNLTSDLYIIQGLQRQQVRVNIEDTVAGYNTRKFENIGIMREGILYIVGFGKNDFNTRLIYSYGAYFPGDSNSLQPGFKHLTSNQIKGLSLNLDSFNIFVDNDGGSNLGKIYTQDYRLQNYNKITNQTGNIYSYPLIGNYGINTIKTLKRIYVSYKLTHQNDIIKIYAKKNGGPFEINTGFTLIKTITGSTYLGKMGARVDEYELKKLNLGDFYQLEYKVELISGYNASPILFNIKTVYIDNLKD